MNLRRHALLAIVLLAGAGCSAETASVPDAPTDPAANDGVAGNDDREPTGAAGNADAGADAAPDGQPDDRFVAIASTTPADGAKGVFKDAPISIVFTKPMKPATVLAAYGSTELPQDSASFDWNGSGDTLTVTPNVPLEYAAGAHPKLTPAKTYSITIGAAAEASDGTTLGAPHTFTFSTLRKFTVLEFPVQDKTRTVMASGVVHNSDIDLYVGDSDVVKDVEMRAVFTFRLLGIPADAKGIESATFRFTVDELTGDPFGLLTYVHISNENVTAGTYSAPSLENAGYSLGSSPALGQRVTQVEQLVWSDVQNRAQRFEQTQFRVSFNNHSKVNNQGDNIRLARSQPSLTMQYLIE